MSEKKTTSFREKLLAGGYIGAFILAFFGIVVSTFYLFSFLSLLTSKEVPVNMLDLLDRTSSKRLMLLSTAIFVAMSFGFLGFALFLMQAKGDSEGDFGVGNYKIKLVKLSPGLFVILCSTVIIIVCATFQIGYDYNNPEPKPSSNSATVEMEDEIPEPDPEDIGSNNQQNNVVDSITTDSLRK